MDAANLGCQVSPSGSPRLASAIGSSSAATFVPVSIVNSGSSAQLEIELANGCVVRLTGSIDPGLLQALIMAAGQLNGSGQGDR
jgi:hypothetical protein